MLDGLSVTAPSGAPPAALPTIAALLAWRIRRAELEIEVGRAASYNLQYQRKLLKRSATSREYSHIDRQIRRVGHMRVVLDIPCGDSPRDAGVQI